MKWNNKITFTLIISAVLLFFGAYVFAYNPYDDPAVHAGAYCSVCHEKFAVQNTDVVKMFPCVKKPCHLMENRAEFHVQDQMCEKCHAALAGEYDIHAIHKDKANCQICHMSERGWNSSSVIVPDVSRSRKLEGEAIGVPSKQCSYCHKAAENAKSMHDIHKPSGDSACHGCHSQVHDGGDICVSCHNKFSVGKNNSCLAECHKMPVEERYSAHMGEKICEDCHTAVLGGADIHSVHKGEVDCSICHTTPRGWNSSVATVPEPRKTAFYDQEGLLVPRSKDCFYCHKTVDTPKRVHDIHLPVLQDKCPKCHGTIKNESLEIWGWPTVSQKEEGTDFINLITNEFSKIFQKKKTLT